MPRELTCDFSLSVGGMLAVICLAAAAVLFRVGVIVTAAFALFSD